jgi:CubicO group peptidase (beta-lactamase class C family)
MNSHICFTTAISFSAGLVITLLSSTAAHAQDQPSLTQVRELYQLHTPQNFDDGGLVSHYVWKNFTSFYPHATIARTSPERLLEGASETCVANFSITTPAGDSTLQNYVENSPLVDGVIVLAGGRIVYESYPRMKPFQRHLGWSVTKVIVSTALAALESMGKVDMEQPADNYVPELAGTQWQGISLRNIVNMASGISCLDRDGYQNTETCIYRYEESMGLTAPVNPPQTTIENLVTMRRHLPAGEKYEYVSANTFVTGLVVENITNQPLWLALQDLVWNKTGAEADAMMMISPDGSPATHGGISARLRDVARFGQIFTATNGLEVIGKDHLQDLSSNQGIRFDFQQLESFERRFPGDVPTHAAWQWDMIWPDGAMFKGGYSGQGIFVDPNRDVVVAWYGTSNPDGDSNRLLPIARRLTQSALFDD